MYIYICSNMYFCTKCIWYTYILMYDVYVIHICVFVHESACMCGELEKKSGEERSMYASAHILTLGFVCVNLCMQVYIGMSMFMYESMYLYAWVLCMCICTGTYMCYYIHEYEYVCMDVYEQVHTCTFQCENVNLCVDGWCYLGGYNSFRCCYYYKQSFSPGR